MERDSWVNEISAGCIKQAQACKCFMEARAVFHNSCNTSDKWRNGNKPECGRMISLVLSAARAAARRRQINY